MQDVYQKQKDKLRRNLELLREREKENKLLSSVVQDYTEYEKRLQTKDELLKEQSNAHEKHLQMLSAYIQDIMESNELTETGINKLKHENQRIWDMIQTVKTI
jgi:hypothetical protein